MINIPSCGLCPHLCRVPRDAQTGGGRCGMSAQARVSLASLHMWEEPPISGTNGSGAVFFVGCTLGCVFCQNYEISRSADRQCEGREYTPQQLAETFAQLEDKGAHNINLVTGTHFIPSIIAAMKIYRPRVPVVFNCGGYESAAAIDAIAPYVDIWLPDYKYALSKPAQLYSGVADYPQTALAALLRMRKHQPQNVIENGIMQKGMIVRHLVLPLNTANSIAALEVLAKELPDTPVSLMSQYTPVTSDPRFSELHRRITRREYDKVCDAMLRLGIDGYVQDMEASKTAYIPKWDN